VPDNAEHLDRCWLELDRKRALHVVGDQIGLVSPETVVS
jgi:hypothetical protein